MPMWASQIEPAPIKAGTTAGDSDGKEQRRPKQPVSEVVDGGPDPGVLQVSDHRQVRSQQKETEPPPAHIRPGEQDHRQHQEG